ncbi:MAG: CHAD domain-containing protein [Fibrella sp.]|nr:CHAD domain-containing protein [Armatimonadota bacterium]
MAQNEAESATISPETNFRDAARITLRSAFLKMMKNAPETRSGLLRREPKPAEVEALHDMRVGTRRLRAALSVFARIFPRDEYRDIEREVAVITDALAAVRDLDVQREALAGIVAEMPANEAYGIERLRTRLAKQRDTERESLIRALKKLEKSRFEKRFAQALERATTVRKKGA